MDILLKQLKNKKQINIAEFMELVVPYYYQNNIAIGADGDFITAPEISQLFGEMIAIWIANHCITKSIYEINLIEMGPGRGTLMYDILHTLHSLSATKDIVKGVYLLESSKKLRKIQAEKLQDFKNINWIDDLAEVSNQNHPNIVIANEFFDCLPIRQFVKTKHGLHEIFIDFESDTPCFALKKTKQKLSLTLEEGEVYEICEDYKLYSDAITSLLKGSNSAGLIIDYGYVDRPIKGTLQALKKHKHHDILSDIGSCDLTALVNFSKLEELFKASAVNTKLHLQGGFLKAYGISERAHLLGSKVGRDFQVDVKRLTDEDQMGNLFKVLEIFA